MMRSLVAGLALAGSVMDAFAGDDFQSYANVDQFRVTHLEMALDVDFKSSQLLGNVALEIKRLDPHATRLVLDTRELMITAVSQLSTDIVGATEKTAPIWVNRPFLIGKADPILGSPLFIDLPPSRETTEVIKVEYETSPRAAALHWLTPSQTQAKHQPFLFTLSEPISARSWIPLQDTPQIRMTYRAHVRTPDDLLAVMSAENDPKARRNGDYWFVMPQAVPSYLIALAVGDLAFKATGPRTGVYAERSGVKAAAKQFADAEAVLRAFEHEFGPYRWSRYDVLAMPPSVPTARALPSGSMANPRLSFVAPVPAQKAGDAASPAPAVHDLGYAWSGNLATNASWTDLWLNEGIAAYLSGRVLVALYGRERAGAEDALDWTALRDAVRTLKPADQALSIDLRDRDPEAAFTAIPYAKGKLLLTTLDAKFGRERFDSFLRAYFDHFAFQSLTTEQFLNFLQENLLDRFPGIVTRDEVVAWIVEPGIPQDAAWPPGSAT